MIFNTFDLGMCFAPQRRVHFFEISTSKSRPRSSVSDMLDFEICSAPQQRALFEQLFFQKWSETETFPTGWTWLWNLLCATAACSFWTALSGPTVRHCAVFSVLTSKFRTTTACSFFISNLHRWFRTRCFDEPTLRPPPATRHSKKTLFQGFFFLPFCRPGASLFPGLLSPVSSLTLPTSALPVHIVGSLTSKLPAMIQLRLAPDYDRFRSKLLAFCARRDPLLKISPSTAWKLWIALIQVMQNPIKKWYSPALRNLSSNLMQSC